MKTGTFTDDRGNPSFMRFVLGWLLAAFLVWNTLMLCVHLFVAKQPITDIFSGGYLSWTGEMLGILLGSKVPQKGVEVIKDIKTPQQ